jgi:hypothetical protein
VFWSDSGHQTPHAFPQIPLSGEISGIPEYHDCQRFIREDGDTYGSLYAIYAAFHLESLPCGLGRCGYGASGAVGIPAATILSYGGRYAPLSIQNGFNCLYLWDPPDWKAVIIPQGANPDCRVKRVVEPLPSEAHVLPVHVVQPGGSPPFRDREYPPVARWDWDSSTNHQFIGIRCGLAWCEIGGTSRMYPPTVPGFDAVPGISASTAMSNAVTRVKGWFDAERLAVMLANPTGAGLKVRPSRITGFIVPNPVLGDLQASHFARKWVHVAWALVDADYKSTVHFSKGRNKISLCNGALEECELQRNRLECRDTTNVSWWAMVEDSAGSVYYRCVTFRGYPSGIDVPGTVRWRWQADDQTNWIKCPSGCCELK